MQSPPLMTLPSRRCGRSLGMRFATLAGWARLISGSSPATADWSSAGNLPDTAGLSTRDAEIFEKDLDHVTHKLFAAVYDPQHVVRLSRDELLGRLGWKDRFEYRNRHSFPVNEVLYQPIDDSREALERSLNELGGGYVAVLGTPGSGKSTLLTQTLRYLPQRVIRYYAYIPDAQSSAVRGESINFLYDVVRAIEEAGFRPGQSINHPDRVCCCLYSQTKSSVR